jgi:dephospho-CoA kinase
MAVTTRTMVLTGGIGSGKSAVGSVLASFGAHVVDADKLAREVVQRGSHGFGAVVAEFGPSVVAPDGSLDRSALAAVVFHQPDRLHDLEAIVHPLVESLAAERLAEGADSPLVVYEVPLSERIPPFGGGSGAAQPVLVVVDAPDEVRRARLRQRGLSDEQITARMANQPTREAWLARADRVIDNSGDLDALALEVAQLWSELTDASPPVSPAG